jgi:oxalate decarboxylase
VRGSLPGPLEAVRSEIRSAAGDPPNPFIFSLADGPRQKQSKGGFVQIADSTNFKAATTVAAALVTVHPGGMREMHWHPNADEWQYYIKAIAQMTVFNAGPKAVTTNFRPGDIGYVKRSNGHYVKNTGDTDLVFLEVFNSNRFQDISLSDWLAHTLTKFPRGAVPVTPA